MNRIRNCLFTNLWPQLKDRYEAAHFAIMDTNLTMHMFHIEGMHNQPDVP